MANRKYLDCYEGTFNRQADFVAEVNDMEENSSWIDGVPTTEFRLESLFPLEVFEKAKQYKLDESLAMETASENEGTQLILSTIDKKMLVRGCAKASLCEAAKLSGSALMRMNPTMYGETLNNGFEVARGNSKILIRYGKVSSLHSDGDTGYAVMPIPELLDSVLDVIQKNFGRSCFVRGYNSHSYTDAIWTLPDVKNEMTELYQDALDDANYSSVYDIDFMPAIRFNSSDTSNSCASLQPLFEIQPGRYVSFCEGVKVKHTKKNDGTPYGLELFKDEINSIYAKFKQSADQIRNLASIDIRNPENTIIGLCRKFNIAKRYGEAARNEMSNMLYDGRPITAHDVYLAMSAAVEEAIEKNASKYVVNTLDETLARICQITDWSEFDVGGVVAWKD